jgi:hypothetical protein
MKYNKSVQKMQVSAILNYAANFYEQTKCCVNIYIALSVSDYMQYLINTDNDKSKGVKLVMEIKYFQTYVNWSNKNSY